LPAAARLKLGLQQRQQLQQHQQGLAAKAAPTAGMLSTLGTGAAHNTSSKLFKPAASNSRQLAVGAAGASSAFNATARAASATRGAALQAMRLPYQQQQATPGVAAAAAASSSIGWGLKARQDAAAAAVCIDGEPAYFNVDELKHDLERALRKVG
jgi:hypothetical protein